jgi:iron complex outermembrane receptor protein
MKKNYLSLKPIALAVAMMSAGTCAYANQNQTILEDVVVTAAQMTTPTTIELDPKVPRQPLPAHDGADFLKTVPGFSVMRKAGADGEPNFRGMGGSRVNILADDQNIFGGCGQRMDAPTAYIFPEIYDKVTVIKGPQTVLYPGHGSAATVRFEKEQKTYDKPGYDVHASGLVGSFGRHDEVVDANLGNKDFFATFTGSNSKSDNYKDGNGNEVHSKYHRYSASSSVGVTPDNNKRFELSAGRSDGYAAYADRTLDGTKFLRENIAGKGQIKNISDLVEKINFQISRNSIFHTMSSAMRSANPSGMDVSHETNAARVTADLALRPSTKAKVGADYSQSTHSGNMSLGAPLTDDSEFKNVSLFAEVTEQLSKNNKLIAGYRGESWEVADKRSGGASTTSGQTRKEFTNSAFARVERALDSIPNSTAFVGFGRSERMPDYWELISNKQNSSGASALMSTKTEKTNQLDLGLLHKSGPFDLSASAFYNKINDFILVDARNGYAYSTHHGATPSSRNIDAHTYGAEITSGYALSNVVRVNSSIAYVKGKNETDGLPLAQLAPLEGRLSLAYDDKKYSYGALLRLVAAKDQVAVGQGNISGQDVAKSGGFGIFSLNAGYKPNKKTLIAAGVDNVFDKAYAEFISRAGANVGGYIQTTRVNEPGRTAWLKATIALD